MFFVHKNKYFIYIKIIEFHFQYFLAIQFINYYSILLYNLLKPFLYFQYLYSILLFLITLDLNYLLACDNYFLLFH